MNNPIWTDKDLGVVSAFGVAKENGWTGTEAEWEALQAAAPQKASDAEAYAAGTRNGTEVESDDPAYHNNAAYYAGQAKGSETAAAGSAASAAASAADALQHTQGVIETWLEDNIDPDSGYALDRTLALPSAAAPADMVGDLKSALESSFYDGIRSYAPITNGSYAKAGPTNNVANRIRTDLIQVSKGDTIEIKNGSLVHACGAWNGTVSTNNNIRNDSSWNSSNETITSVVDGYYLIAFAKQDTTTNLSPSDFDGEINVTNTIMYKNEQRIESLEELIANGYYETVPSIRGSYSAYGIYSSTTRIITNYIPVHIGDIIEVNNGTLVHACAAWNGTVSSGNNVRNDNSWNNQNETITSVVNGFYVVAFAKSNTSQEITLSDFDGYIHVYSSYFTRHKIPEYEVSRIQAPFIIDPGDLFAKPTVGYRNNQIQSENRVNTKFGIFKSGNNFCITYAENVDGTNLDAPDLSESGQMEYKYRYFHFDGSTESDVSRGGVAKKGDTYIDRDGNQATITGGVSFGSSVNGRLFLSFAFTNTNISGLDYKPCSCTVTLSDNGVTFGDIYELKLVVDGVTGEFNTERMGDWKFSFYTSNPPYHDSDGYRWFMPVSEGFAYLTSSDGITWTLQNICKTPYKTFKEVGMSKIDNNLLIFAARAYNEDDTSDGFNTFVGVYKISTNEIIRHYRLPSASSKPVLLNCGTWNASDNLLAITDPTMTYAVYYKVIYRDTLEFVKWFEMYHNATYYMNVLQNTIENTDFTEMYIVGNNGQISNHSSSFIKLAFPATGARDTRDIPFTLQ